MHPLVRVPTLPGVQLRLPPQLEGLRRLAYNLYWSWHPQARVLFSYIDAAAWSRYRNPVAVLAGSIPWADHLENASFMSLYHDVIADFDAYLAAIGDHWFRSEEHTLNSSHT